MDQQPNPYAPPRADTDLDTKFGGATVGLRREGNLLVIPTQGASFPPRCVMCNAAAHKRLKRKLFWHAPGYYALICVGALIYVIVAMIVRKSAAFEVALCELHATRRRNGILLGWIGVPLLFIAATVLMDQAPFLGPILMLAGVGVLITALLMVRNVTAARIQDGQAWLKVGQPFLDSI
jgi:hypothetical protein